MPLRWPLPWRWRLWGGVAVSTTALAAPPVAKSAVAQASAGQLDTSFGRANDGTPDGIVNLSLGDGNDTSAAVAVQADQD